jgi:hypothetical protein
LPGRALTAAKTQSLIIFSQILGFGFEGGYRVRPKTFIGATLSRNEHSGKALKKINLLPEFKLSPRNP